MISFCKSGVFFLVEEERSIFRFFSLRTIAILQDKYFADFTCFDAQNARTLHVSMEKNTVVLQLKIQAYETQP